MQKETSDANFAVKLIQHFFTNDEQRKELIAKEKVLRVILMR